MQLFVIIIGTVVGAVLALFIDSLRPKKLFKEVRSFKRRNISGTAAWMAAYHGPFRPDDYHPPIKEESEKMIFFLNDFSSAAAFILRNRARDALLSGRLPDIIDPEDYSFNWVALAIGDVCEDFQIAH